MRVYWLDGGLRLEPESNDERARVVLIETAIRALADTQIAEEVQGEGFTSVELDQAALGIANSPR